VTCACDPIDLYDAKRCIRMRYAIPLDCFFEDDRCECLCHVEAREDARDEEDAGA